MYQLEELCQRGNTLSGFLVFVRFESAELLNSSGEVSDSLSCAEDA